MSSKYFKSLLYKSTKLRQEILKEQKQRWPDWARLMRLKKIRLAMKDKMYDIAEQSVQAYSMKQLEPARIKYAVNRKRNYS